MTIRARINRLARNKMLRSIGVLVGGTMIAHVITAISLPVLTRLYTPADFSVLAMFASTLAIISVASCLRFDVAIAIPAQDGEAANLLVLAIACAAIVSMLVAAAGLSVPNSVLHSFHQSALIPWLPLLPLGVLLAGAYSALQMWFVRKKAFTSIASSRVLQSAAASSVQVGMGWLHWAPGGLLLGQLLNTGAGVTSLAYRFARHEREALAGVSWAGMRSAWAAYDRFPKYSTLEALANSASIQLPIILIAALAPGAEAGFLVLAMAALQAPMGLIGTAVSQVYLSRGPDEERGGRLGTFTTKLFGGLVRTGVGPLLLTGFVAPSAFAFVFGAEWRRAGELVAWMTPWFVMQFLASPVSMALHITGHQQAAFVLQIFGLVFRTAAVVLASLVAIGFVSEAYALSGFVFYAIYLATVLRVAKAKASAILHEIRRNAALLVLWTASGFAIARLIDFVVGYVR